MNTQGMLTSSGKVGSVKARATLGDLTSNEVVIGITPDVVKSLTKVADFPTSPVVGSTHNISVRTADRFDNPVPGTTITFETSGQVAVSPASTTADSTGIARTTVTVGATAGAGTVVAMATGLAPLTYSASSVPGAAASIAREGTLPTNVFAGAAYGDSIRVVVRDAHGIGVPGAVVAFAVTAGGGIIADARVAVCRSSKTGKPASPTLGDVRDGHDLEDRRPPRWCGPHPFPSRSFST